MSAPSIRDNQQHTRNKRLHRAAPLARVTSPRDVEVKRTEGVVKAEHALHEFGGLQ